MSTLCECEKDLSIIIPVYNLEHHIFPIIDTLMHQNLNGYTIEVLFVLNNCTDRSEEVIRESGIDCSILYCDKQGCGCARNVGIEEAKGQYIWFMDGDDWLMDDDAIKDVLDKAKAEDLNILWIPFASDLYRQNYYSMVWQYLLRKDFIADERVNVIGHIKDEYLEVLDYIKAGSRFIFIK